MGHGGWLIDLDEGHGGHKNGVIKVELRIPFNMIIKHLFRQFLNKKKYFLHLSNIT